MSKKNTAQNAAAVEKTTAVRHSAIPPVAAKAESKKVETSKVETAKVEAAKAETSATAVAERPQPAATPAAKASATASAAAPAATETSAKVAALIAQLGNPAAELGVEAAEKLADLAADTSDARISDALVEVLANADGYFNLVTRAAAAMALGRLKDGRAVDTLIATTQDNQAEVSGEAVLALGQLKAKSALPTLHTIVANEGNYFLNVTRHAALRALGKIADASSRPTLEAVAGSDWEDPALVAAARQALTSL